MQFLTAYNALVSEALEEARSLEYDGVPTRVLAPEHLAAIMLQTGRPKDKLRFTAFIEQAPLDPDLLADVLSRHRLTEVYRAWTT